MSRRLVLLTLGVLAACAVLRAVQAAAGSGSLADLLAEVRLHAAEREQELRAQLGLDGRHDVVDAGL